MAVPFSGRGPPCHDLCNGVLPFVTRRRGITMSRFLRFTVAITLSVCATAAVAVPSHASAATTADAAVAACTTCWT